MRNFIKKSEKLPVGAIATALAVTTLSNAYLLVGDYVLVRHLSMIAATLVWCAAITKFIVHFATFKEEYIVVVPSSLYGTFTMLTIILGSYYFEFNEVLGIVIWLAGIVMHTIHILIFTWRNVVKGINRETFIPSWFVTYLGVLVSAVVGVQMGMPNLIRYIVYYGFVAFAILLPLMLYRLIKYPLQDQFKLTTAILVAPSSLCLIGYLNVSTDPSLIIIFGLYIVILIKLIYIYNMIPIFLKKKFNPGFAALTFPLAISVIASIRMSQFLTSVDMEQFGMLIYQISGIQLYITTAIIGYIAYNFLITCFPNLLSN